MKKKTVVIILAVVVILMLGAYGVYVLFNNMFPYAAPIKQLDMNMVESIRMYDNADNEIVIGDAEMQKLISYINVAEATRTMSVNDYPGVRPYYVIEIKTEERVFRYIVYTENGTSYAEIPYEGVYEIDREVIDVLD